MNIFTKHFHKKKKKNEMGELDQMVKEKQPTSAQKTWELLENRLKIIRGCTS